MALQQRDQDILNAISLVKFTKRQLQNLRDDGFDAFMEKVLSFSEKNNTEMLNMAGDFVDSRMPRKITNKSNLHHYKVNCFYTVLDMQLQEFNDRFNELMRLAEFYLDDFSFVERKSLDHQLDIYHDNVQQDDIFTNLKSLGDLAQVMVETRKHLSHPLIYRLVKLSLILLVAASSNERCFSVMNIVKTTSRNRIGDQFLSDCLVCYIKIHDLESVINETVIKRFQNMSERRIHLEDEGL
ncbi:PREDICTED: uncharacterized protein LOC104728537 [Camelina sativa]|uniref:Uncharacterized protein LOC104728537 n=1 Tax=Camelina sativa TaxID=90675 RepID=A0ABM0USY5_CAMSA|nr:PREDICTED: uncharacterized protein LOC104728537 [Camelina sativa]